MASIEQSIAHYARNGKIRLNWSGTDCDGVGYSQSCITDAATVATEIEAIRFWADGPVDIGVSYPQ